MNREKGLGSRTSTGLLRGTSFGHGNLPSSVTPTAKTMKQEFVDNWRIALTTVIAAKLLKASANSPGKRRMASAHLLV